MEPCRTSLVPVLALIALSSGAVGACARGDAVSRTTVTSATTGTDPTRIEDAALRLADEVCKRKASCVADAQNEGSGTSWSWTSTSDCVERERPRLEQMLSSWACSPVSAEARLEACLPAVKTASCEPLLANDTRLPVCPTTETCLDPIRR